MNDERLGLPSASSAMRFVRCPGSVALINRVEAESQKLLPPPKDDATTTSGTKIHESIATGDKSDLDMTEAEITDRLSALEQETLASWLAHIGATFKDVKTIRETRFFMRNDALEIIGSAKPDVIFVAKDMCALIINFKTGYKETTRAAANWQVRMEALSIWHDCGKLPIRIRAGFAQYRFKGNLSFVDYSPEDLERSDADYAHALWRSQQADSARYAGEWCDWCPAKAWCPELAVWSLMPMARSYDADALSLEDAAFFERRRLLAEKFFDAITTRLKRTPPEELATVLFALKDSKDARELTKLTALQAELETLTLLNNEEFMNLCSMSIGALSEVIVEKMKALNPQDTVKDIKQVFDTIINPFVGLSPRGPRLVDLKKK